MRKKIAKSKMNPKKKSPEENSAENDSLNKSDELLSSLKKAVENLFYISETDAPFEAFVWKTETPINEITADKVLKLAGESPNAKVTEKSMEEFFKQPTELQDWFGDEEKSQVEKYLKLKELFATKLKNARVFKVGEPQINVYIVGTSDDGNLAGVKTKAVET
jgi:hypothetical protein